MTSAAGLAFLHLWHAETHAVGSSDEYRAVTVTAFKERSMGLVTETGIKCLKSNVFDIRMTLLAITLDRKSSFSIVAGTTRLANLHITHGFVFTVGARYKQLIVTIRTAIRHIKMNFVAEN